MILHVGDPLVWWESDALAFPTICHVARDILQIPTSSVSVAGLFSSGRYVMRDLYNPLVAPIIQDLEIAKSWQKR